MSLIGDEIRRKWLEFHSKNPKIRVQAGAIQSGGTAPENLGTRVAEAVERLAPSVPRDMLPSPHTNFKSRRGFPMPARHRRRPTMIRYRFLTLLFLAALGTVDSATASTVTAASCSNTAVQSAINSAAPGDIVAVPAGNCTWTGGVTVASKALTLSGAGVDVTNITDGIGGALRVTGASSTNFVTITGFTFIKSANNSGGAVIQISGGQDTVGFRLHHSSLSSSSSGIRGVIVESVYGLIDHFTWNITGSATGNQALSVWGSSAGSDGGFTPWQRPLAFGTPKAVYLEDSTMNYPAGVAFVEDSIDAYAGARLVIRYNTFNNASIGFHGTDTGGMRSPVSFEVYNNTFVNNSASQLRGMTIRGGAAVVHNNSYTGPKPWGQITLMLYRVVQPQQAGGWQVCNGTRLLLGSASLSADASRTASSSGTVGFSSTNRDLLGPFGTGTYTTYLDGSGSGGYPCRDQPGVGPGQIVQGIYAWNNSGGVQIDTYDGGSGISDANYLQPGRDYFNGVQRPGYTTYTYPYPATGTGSGSTVPTSPSNLRIISQ